MSRQPRNILFLWTDQQRPDTIGAYRGSVRCPPVGPSAGDPPIQTPHLDRLAGARGVGSGATLFEQAYCAQPVCSPSRASVLTGLYPHTHGVLENGIPLRREVPTLAALLRPAGYACGYIGKWHLGNEAGLVPPGRHGFDERWVSTEDGYFREHATEGYSAYYHFLVARGYTRIAS